MERWRGRVAVVTGASAGIGAAVAYQLQDAGLTVVALARRKDKIRSAVEEARRDAKERGRESLGKAPSPGQLHALKCDVSKEEDIVAAFKWAKEHVGAVHVLVNNAGAGGGEGLEEITSAEMKRVFGTNVLGLSLCTREAVSLMRAAGVDDGHIVHVGSVDADHCMHLPGAAAYVASKGAVRVLAEGLRRELVSVRSSIRVTEVRPGSVQAEAEGEGEGEGDEVFLRPEDVAHAVLFAVSAPAHVQVHCLIVRPVGETF